MSATTNKTTVVVPAFNHEAYVEECIESIWNQGADVAEIVALDDGSTDQTGAALESLKARSPLPMTVVRKTNEGICRTLNRGLALVQTPFVSFLASDDMLLPGKLLAQSQYLVGQPGVSGVYGDVVVVNASGQRIADRSLRPPSGANELRFLDLLLWRSPFNLQAGLFRTDVVRTLGFDETLTFEDRDFYLRLTRSHVAHYSPGPVVAYRMTPGSASSGQSRHEPSLVKLTERAISEAPELTQAERNQAWAAMWLYLAHEYYRGVDLPNARRCALRSLATRAPGGRPAALNVLLRSLLGRRLLTALRTTRRGRRSGQRS